jgi:hypothetical protein
MKRIRAKTKSKPKKAKAKKAFIAKRKREKRQGVRSLRGKYKHLDLMKGLVDARKEERKSERIHSKTKKTKSRPNGRGDVLLRRRWRCYFVGHCAVVPMGRAKSRSIARFNPSNRRTAPAKSKLATVLE